MDLCDSHVFWKTAKVLFHLICCKKNKDRSPCRKTHPHPTVQFIHRG